MSWGNDCSVTRTLMMEEINTILGGAAATEYTHTSTLASAIDDWLVTFETHVSQGKRSLTTLDTYRYEASRLVIPGIGGLRLAEVTAPRLDRFIQDVRAEKGYATAKACRQVLSGVCGWLVRQGALSPNPLCDLTPLRADDTEKTQTLTPAQLRAWLSVLDGSAFARRHDLPDLARFMLATGLRLGETFGVTWADLDLTAGVVNITRTIVRVKGKGLVAKSLKSQAAERVLSLPGWCVELLKDRQNRVGRLDDPIFPDTQGGWRDTSNTAKAFREVRKNTEFEWVTSHTYRKTAATILDHSGATAHEIAAQLGHTRASMTQEVYMSRRASKTNAASLSSHNPHDSSRYRASLSTTAP
ncbi:MAG: tyrosine-type recombinase/integrase [Rhodoglobus sp.]